MPNIYHYNTDYRKDKKHPIYISPLKTWKKMPKPPEIEPIPFGLLTNCSAYYIDQTTHKNTSGNFPGPGKTNLENLEWGLPLGNTGIYVPRDKDKLLITSGESWTFGDNMEGVEAGVKDNVESRISNNFSGRTAEYLNADLLFKAIPGSSNQTIIHNLDNLIKCIQEHPNFKNYKEIYIIGQLTSPGRDWYIDKDLGKDIKNPKFIDWFKLREKEDFTSIVNVAKKLPNAKICIWKNFQDFINDYDITENQTYIKKSWMNYTLNLHGRDNIELPMLMESEQWPDMAKEIEIFKNISNITQDINKDLDKLEDSYNVLRNSTINGYHPNEISHFLWAMNIIQQSNWKRDNRKT